MYSRLVQTIHAAESRYLNPQEQSIVLTYCASMPKRLQAMKAVEQKETEIVNQVITELKKRYVNFADLHDRAWEKGFRDVQLVLRYNVQGMLLDDSEMVAQRLLYWMRTIMAAVGMTPRFMRDTYTLLREACRQHLPAEAFQLLEPHLERTIAILSDIPEPHRPAV
ncbi:MAG: hypothetical protein NZ700_17125 [Gemmataceae bacterium]|nr:hypothetical protein [Gemmataceae bacterium]MDW8264124.1 hypothetical protein [Gemmataceae bacterium]